MTKLKAALDAGTARRHRRREALVEDAVVRADELVEFVEQGVVEAGFVVSRGMVATQRAAAEVRVGGQPARRCCAGDWPA